MSTPAISISSQPLNHSSTPVSNRRNVSIQGSVYAIVGLILFSPLILCSSLLYGLYAGVRLIAKQITIYNNKEQAARIQSIFNTTLKINELNQQKTELDQFKTETSKQLKQLTSKLSKQVDISHMHNPLSQEDYSNLPEGTRDVLQKAIVLIDEEKSKAEASIKSTQAAIDKLTALLADNQKSLDDTSTQLKDSNESLNSCKKLYEEAGPLSKTKENIILWKPFNK